jgi:two-component system chemotaxis response regulator CheB
MRIEVDVAAAASGRRAGVENLGPPSRYACPECHGVLFEIEEGMRSRFRCHTGHAYSLETLLDEYDQRIKESLWNAVRGMQEQVMLLRQFAGHVRERHDALRAERYGRRADRVERPGEQVQRLLGGNDENDARRKADV